MAYRKCPKCDTNWITDDEEVCATQCTPLSVKRRISNKKNVENDFSRILRGHNYGGNSRKIYEKFCETLNWDKRKADQFGWQTPLYAKNADSDRMRDVWFIFHANYDLNKLDSVVENEHVLNLIQDDGDTIMEAVADYIGSSNPADRIVFIKTNNGYEFSGVYNIIENGTTRVYKRFSNNYPI